MLLPILCRGTLPDVPSPVVYPTPPSTIAEGRRQKAEAKKIKGFAVSAQPNGFNN
jgi:hypothetical protein